MAVEKSLNRRDIVVLIGPLDELYTESGPIIREYLERSWAFAGSKTDPNQGPRMELTFTRERLQA